MFPFPISITHTGRAHRLCLNRYTYVTGTLSVGNPSHWQSRWRVKNQPRVSAGWCVFLKGTYCCWFSMSNAPISMCRHPVTFVEPPTPHGVLLRSAIACRDRVQRMSSQTHGWRAMLEETLYNDNQHLIVPLKPIKLMSGCCVTPLYKQYKEHALYAQYCSSHITTWNRWEAADLQPKKVALTTTVG